MFETKVDKNQEVEKESSNEDESSESESEEDEAAEPKSFKPVDRLKKKTKKELNKKIVRKAQEEVQNIMREEKTLDHQVDILNTLIRQDEIETKKQAKAEQLRNKIEKEEKDR